MNANGNRWQVAKEVSMPEDLQHFLLCDVLQAVPAGNACAVDQVLCKQRRQVSSVLEHSMTDMQEGM